jgi:hypothetical protein
VALPNISIMWGEEEGGGVKKKNTISKQYLFKKSKYSDV